MATTITDEQRLGLRKNIRFQDMTRASAANFAQLLHGNNGDAPPGVMTKEDWAVQRFFIAEGILQHPNDQDNETWYAQYSMLLKDQAVWMPDPDPLPAGKQPGDATVDFMITANTFASLAEQNFALKAKNIKF